MTTLEQRELAGVSPVIEQSIPTDHNAGEKKDKAHELALDQKAIRLLDGTNEIAPYTHEITDVLWNPSDTILRQINAWNYRVMTDEEAMHTPYQNKRPTA